MSVKYKSGLSLYCALFCTIIVKCPVKLCTKFDNSYPQVIFFVSTQGHTQEEAAEI
jgi:hypothetical protein